MHKGFFSEPIGSYFSRFAGNAFGFAIDKLAEIAPLTEVPVWADLVVVGALAVDVVFDFEPQAD